MKSYIITSALPYANGPLHLGHILEAIQADIWSRAKKICNEKSIYICADDAHGSAIMLSARKHDIEPSDYVNDIKRMHLLDFKNFNIDFDCYHSTNSVENETLVNFIWKKIRPYTYSKDTLGLFDEEQSMFLPDRFVKGKCPSCNAIEQSGDNCEKCSATYDATELVNPISVLSGATPIKKKTKVIYLDINKVKSKIQEWINNTNINPSVRNKLLEWFDKDLQSWAISRDKPYFGFQIPNENEKYFYVWVDAPIGYLATLMKHFGNDKKAIEMWNSSEIYHLIGKDIVNFHGIFWPAMLIMSDLKLPENIIAHGFLNINNQKMSKSKGIMIKASEFNQYGDYELFRYFVASRTNNNIADIDFNLEDFRAKINSSLVGKYINIPSRISSILKKNFDSKSSSYDISNATIADVEKNILEHFKHYHTFNYSKIIKFFEDQLDILNAMISETKPWSLVKTDKLKAQEFCTIMLNCFYKLSILIKPVLPNLVKKIEDCFNLGILNNENIKNSWFNQTINYQPILTRIPIYKENIMLDKPIINNISENKDEAKDAVTESFIDIKDLSKVNLRIAKIVNAVEVEGSDKLLKLTVDWNTGLKTIFAGIKNSYNPNDLIGRMTLVVANLKPRKMRFGVSEAMVLIANDENGLYLLEPDSKAKPGNKVS